MRFYLTVEKDLRVSVVKLERCNRESRSIGDTATVDLKSFSFKFQFVPTTISNKLITHRIIDIGAEFIVYN